MTVEELIKILKTYPKTADVVYEEDNAEVSPSYDWYDNKVYF